MTAVSEAKRYAIDEWPLDKEQMALARKAMTRLDDGTIETVNRHLDDARAAMLRCAEEIEKSGQSKKPLPEDYAEEIDLLREALRKRLEARLPAASHSLIGQDVAIVGTLISSGGLIIDGELNGAAFSPTITVGVHGLVNGDLVGDNIVVRGRISGSVRAKTVVLNSNAHVEGTILHEVLTVEIGAFFEGRAKHISTDLEVLGSVRTSDERGQDYGLATQAFLTV